MAATVEADADAQHRTRRETWRDWLPRDFPEPALVTREQLLEELRRHGQQMSARQLRGLEVAGVLPRPIRRSRRSSGEYATRPQALYPAFWPGALAWFLEHQSSIVTARGPFGFFANLSTSPPLRPAWAKAEQPRAIPQPVYDAISAYMRELNREQPGRVARARLQFLDSDGRGVATSEFSLPEAIAKEIGAYELAHGYLRGGHGDARTVRDDARRQCRLGRCK